MPINMEICSCDNPTVNHNEAGHAYCRKCDNWWMPEHGSLQPGKYHKRTNDSLRRFKIERNDPCLCKSGKKYKQCCLPVRNAAIQSEIVRRRAEQLAEGIKTYPEPTNTNTL